MRHYDVILFDLYGTLVDIETDESQDSAWTSLRWALYKAGAEYLNNDRLRDAFERSVVLANASREQESFFEPDFLPAYRELFEDCWIRADDDMAKTIAWKFRRACTKHIRLFDGAVETLRYLRAQGRRVILVSNAQAVYTRPELQLLHLTEEFDDIVLSSDEGLAKPSPELFRRVIRRANVSPERVLMVGNNERCDVFGSAMYDIDSVYFNTDMSSSTGEDGTSNYAVRSFQGADFQGLIDYIESTEHYSADANNEQN